jgi:hypothetical protein
MNRAAALALLLVLCIAMAACGGNVAAPRGTPVTYKNELRESINVSNDDFLVTTLAAGQSKAITTRRDLLPDRIRAYTERGELVFDRTFTWEDLEALDFTIVISRQ